MDPQTLEIIKSFGQIGIGLATFSVAVFVAIIARENFITTRDTLREKLFNERFAIYKTVQSHLSRVFENGGIPRSEDDGLMPASLHPLIDAMQRSRFLFGDDVADYIKEITDRSLDVLRERIEFEEHPAGSSERRSHVTRHTEHVRWLAAQLNDLHIKFMPYMGFQTREVPRWFRR